MKIDILTLFPSMFEGPFKESLIGRAQKKKILKMQVHSLRKWSDDPRHQKVDDRPFGGGAGMVFRAEPLFRAIKALGGMKKTNKPTVIYMSPQGSTLNQALAGKLAKMSHLILICGHYEGIDERIMEWVDQEISIGDYVLTGGELPAMVLAETVARLIPGVVGQPESLVHESFAKGLLDFPQYTRPRVWRGKEVPEDLLSGHHQQIETWRTKEARKQTKRKKPDLLNKV